MRVAHPAAEPGESGPTRRRPGMPRAVARMAVDFGLPVAVYYGLRAGGVTIFAALLIGAGVSAIIAAVP